jgi:membrane protease YdiL (CAAX protease family)
MQARPAARQASAPLTWLMAAPPFAIVACAAATPALRLDALVAVVAGWGVLRVARRTRLAASSWLATVPAAAILAWATFGPAEVTPGATACSDPFSPAALRRVAELLVAAAAVALLLRERPVSAALGARAPAGRGAVTAAVLAPLALVPLSLWAGPVLAEPFFGPIGLTTSDPAALVPAAAFALANALAEEVAYRGAMIGWAAPVLGTTAAIAGQGVVFGFAHLGADVTGWGPLLWLGMTAAGIGAGIVAVRTRSLLLPVAAHAAFDVPMYYALACRTG